MIYCPCCQNAEDKCICQGCAGSIKNPKVREQLTKSKCKVVYIAGPYRARNGTILENIRAAEQVAIKYWRLGYFVFCPHLNSAFMDGVMPDEHFLESGLEFLRRADVVVFMRGHERSAGAMKELDLAIELKKEIIREWPTA